MDPTQALDPILEFQKLVGERAAYPLVAVLLTFVLQIAKVSPYTKTLYAKTPEGVRWLIPMLSGAAVGFVHGYQAGYTIVGALTEAVMGVFGVSLTSMGVHGLLKDSALPWSGGAGGKKPSDSDPPGTA